MSTMSRWAVACLALVLSVGCEPAPSPIDGGDDAPIVDGSDLDAPPGSTRVRGAVEKGPFVLGSSVTVSAVDPLGNPTGMVFPTMTIDDLGRFELTVDYVGPVSIEATGYYYNEATGELSDSVLTLRSFAEIAGGGEQEIYVNLLTHLAYGRVRTLAAEGMDLRNAIALADRQIRWGMDIGPERYEPGAVASGLQIVGQDDDDAAYLFAIGAVLTQAAVERTTMGGSVDANLQELVNSISLDIGEDGELMERTVAELRAAETAVDARFVEDALLTRVRAVGSSLVVPDLDRGLDSDNDGIANYYDNCPLVPNPDQNRVHGLCRFDVRTDGPRWGSPGSPEAPELAVGDFDGDGTVDLWHALTGPTLMSSEAVTARGDGMGGFVIDPATRTMGSRFFGGRVGVRAPVGDLDGDGDLDIASMSRGSRNVLANDGTGRIPLSETAPPLLDLAGTGTGRLAATVIVDLDGDGSLDVAAAGSPTSGSWRLLVAWGEGTGFGPPAVVASPGPDALHSLFAAEIDDVPGLDLLFAYDVAGETRVWVLAQAAGRRWAAAEPVALAVSGPATSLAVGDFDADGHSDLATLTAGTDIVLGIIHGDGAGGFGRAITEIVGSAGAPPQIVAADGPSGSLLAISIFHPFGREIRVYWSTGSALGHTNVWEREGTGDHFVAGDFNGDGQEDLLAYWVPTVDLPATVVLLNARDVCRTATDGDSCGDGRICLYESCVGTRCGDRFVDPDAYEECDDGNAVSGDGCELGCVFTCTDDAGCNPGDPCSGMSTCEVATHRCMPAGTPLPAGAPCSTTVVPSGVCTGGSTSACAPIGCGNAVVEMGEDCDDRRDGDDSDGCTDLCRFTCAAARDCDDGDACTGTESCDVASHRCVPGVALACTATDACHTARCDSVAGCLSTLVDGDGDGFAATALGVCGTDCNDARADVFPGAEELCDGVDNNCAGGIDEIAPTWFVDCDRDGYAAGVAGGLTACSTPTTNPGCPTGGAAPWTSRRPVGRDTTDCNDGRAATYPGATESWADEIDQDCDGTEICMRDWDDDGSYRTSITVVSANLSCRDPGEALASESPGDCADDDPARRPGVTELAGDQVDQDCDGRELCFVDGDGDGYRLATTVVSTNTSCHDAGEAGAPATVGDCNDRAPSIHSGAVEVVGDGVDQDCDGREVCFVDADGDGYRPGAGTTTIESLDVDCGDPGEAAASDPRFDCRDTGVSASAIHPGAAEVPGDELDQNCDFHESCFRDEDADGHRPDDSLLTSNDVDCRDSGEARPTTPPDDCCDTDSRVHGPAPGSRVYFTETECGGFDYDCDGVIRRLVTRFSCERVSTYTCRAHSGWVSEPPECGVAGAYLFAGPGGEGCVYAGSAGCLPLPGYVETAFVMPCF